MTPRRPTLIAIAVIIAAMLPATLAGCSDEGSSSAMAESAPSGGFAVTIDHVFGSTTVTGPSERVAVVGVTEQDTVLALGITPVAVTEWYGDQPYATWPWAQEALGDATPTVLSTADGLQFERIAATRPDLIIGTNAGLTKKDYEKLSAIAPTIPHSGGYQSAYFEPWDVQALMAGRALGKEAEVTAMIDDLKQRFADEAAAHPEFAGTSAIFLQGAIYEGSAIAYQDGLSTDFLTDLGFTIPANLAAFSKDGEQAYIPLERLSALDSGEVLLWATEEGEKSRRALEATPLWDQLRAVKEDKLVFTDATTAGAIYFTSLLSLPYVLDRLVPALSTALAGDGPVTTS